MQKNLFGFNYDATVPLTTFAQTKELTDQLLSEGVDAIDLKLTGWSKDGLAQTVLDSAAAVGALGGKSGLRELLSSYEGTAVHPYLEADYYKVLKWSFGYSKGSTAARTMSDKTARRASYSFVDYLQERTAASYFILSPLRVGKPAEKFSESLAKLGPAGVAAGEMTALVPTDFRTQGNNRQHSVEAVKETLRTLADGRSLMAQGGNAYALACARVITDAPAASGGIDMADESVPFYQLAVSGLVQYAYEPVNLTGDPYAALLTAAETGASLRFTLMAAEPSALEDWSESQYYSVYAPDWMDTVTGYQQQLQEILAASDGSALYSHRTVLPGVTETLYENGCSILVNRTDEPVEIDGTAVPANAFAIKGGMPHAQADH